MPAKHGWNGKRTIAYKHKNKYASTICIEKTFCEYCGDLLLHIHDESFCKCDNQKTGDKLFNGYSGEPLTIEYSREIKNED